MCTVGVEKCCALPLLLLLLLVPALEGLEYPAVVLPPCCGAVTKGEEDRTSKIRGLDLQRRQTPLQFRTDNKSSTYQAYNSNEEKYEHDVD